MPKKRIIETVALMHIKNRKLLMARAFDATTFYMPGGTVEEHEEHIDALIRELKEELDIDLIPSSIRFYKMFEGPAHNQPLPTVVKIHTFTADFNGIIRPTTEIVDVQFFSSHDYLSLPDKAPAGIMIFNHLCTAGLVD